MKKNIKYYINLIVKNRKERSKTFNQIPSKLKPAVFLRLSKHTRYQVLSGLDNYQTVNLLEALDPDDATDVLQMFDKKTQERLVGELSEDIKEQVALLLKFDRETAGGLMTLNYIQVDIDETILNTAKKFRLHEKRTGKPPEIIVLNQNKVIGYVPGYAFGFAGPKEKIKEYIKPIKKIYHGASTKEVIETIRNYPHKKLVVFDEDKNLVGVIYVDDVLRVLKEKEASSLYDFAGVRGEEEITDPARLKIRFRYKWLMINLMTTFLAAGTVSLFRNTLDKYVLLAVYMPIVAGMGGNAGTQTLAVMVRGISLKQISFKNFLRPLSREVLTGFVNGLINGTLVFTIVMLLNRNFMIALVLAVAMVFNLVIAAFFGTLIPLVMKHFNKDPASSATVFITTTTDVLGFMVFLGLATFLLK